MSENNQKMAPHLEAGEKNGGFCGPLTGVKAVEKGEEGHIVWLTFEENIKGKLCADKGYIGQALFENLFLNGIQLVTKVKSNMKNSLMSIADKILLRKRALIETVNDELKNIAQIEHSRHRSFNNFIANSLSAIAAYCFFEKKPAIDVNFVNDGQLTIF